MTELRTTHVNIRMRPEERARIERAAKVCGERLTEYCRRVLFSQSRRDLLRVGRK